MMDFVHLHVHTEYSFLDGASRIGDLVSRAAADEMPALAITDHGGMFGVIEFVRACQQAGIKPLVGCEVYVARRSRFEKDARQDSERFHLTLLAENEEGYRNLLQLVSAGWLEGFYFKPRVDRDLLKARSGGLIALSGCLLGEMSRSLVAGDLGRAEEVCSDYVGIFGRDRFFVEVMDHGLPEQGRILPQLVDLANAFNLPVVATNDSHYTKREHARTHDVLLCIQTGKTIDDPDRMSFGSDQFWFKSRAEMGQVFADHGEWLANTLAVAERCSVDIGLGQRRRLPFRRPDKLSPEDYLRGLCEENLPRRYDPVTPEVRERLEMELEVIIRKDYAEYFLIVWDLCKYARDHGILLGFRGSAGGSLVAYVLGIHDLDPLEWGLIFERFLNPERDDPPDIDLDLPDDRREEIIRYLAQRYGADRVAQVVTYGTLAGRAAIRDAGRALNVPLPEVDRIAKLIPPMASIDTALNVELALSSAYQEGGRLKDLIDTARAIEGSIRHASTHAAAIVISDEPLTDSVPVFGGTDAAGVTTQYSMDALKSIGLEKFDLLGLKTLTVVRNALRNIEQRRGIRLDPERIPQDDPKTFQLLCRSDTAGIFQLESAGMRRLVGDLQPESIRDMAPLVALYRPGPIQTGMLADFVEGRHGRRAPTYRHPILEPILRETYGVMVYQEQIMQIAREMAGFSMGQADTLRSAMGKKRLQIMEQMRAEFMAGALRRGVSGDVAQETFNLMAGFAAYCFNKPHAVAYGLLAYQTAYLKANYPGEFMAAQLTSFMDDKNRVALYSEEARRLGVEVKPPDVDVSGADFTVDDEGNIRFGLAAIKGVGRAAVEAIEQARSERPFTDLFDFCARVRCSVVSRALIENLVRCGCFDGLGERGAMLAMVPDAYALGQRLERDRASGQTSLFGAATEEAGAVPATVDASALPPMSLEEKLAAEKELLGVYVTDNPLRALWQSLRGRVTHDCADLPHAPHNSTVTVGGHAARCKQITTKTGAPMMFFTLQDITGEVEVVVLPQAFERYRPLLTDGAAVVVTGRNEVEDAPRRAEDAAEDYASAKVVCASIVAAGEAPVLEEQKPGDDAPVGEQLACSRGPEPREGEAMGEGTSDDVPPSADEAAWGAPPPIARVHIGLSSGPGATAIGRLEQLLRAFPGPDHVVVHVPLRGGEGAVAVDLGDGFRAYWCPRLREQVEGMLPGCRIWEEGTI